MKKILLLLVCATTLGIITIQAQTNFKFGKSELKEINQNTPEIFTPGDGFLYSFYGFRSKYGRQSLFQINKLDKELNVVDSKSIEKNNLGQLILSDGEVISIHCGPLYKEEAILVYIKKFNPEKLEFEDSGEIDRFPIGFKADAAYDGTVRVFQNKTTGNILLLHRIRNTFKKDKDNKFMYAVCFTPEGEKIWSNTFGFGSFYSFPDHNKGSTRPVFIDMSTPRQVLLTNDNKFLFATYSNNKENFELKIVSDNGQTVESFPLDVNDRYVNDLILHETNSNEILVVAASRKIVGSKFTYFYTSSLFNINNKSSTPKSELEVNNKKANQLFDEKTENIFLKKREKLLKRSDNNPVETFFITNIFETDNSYIALGEDMFTTISSNSSDQTVNNNIVRNFSFAQINKTSEITGIDVFPRRHKTYNDFRKYSQLGVVESKDNFVLFYLDAANNVGAVKGSYTLWKGNSASSTHIAKITIDKHTGTISKDTPVAYPNSSYGIIPNSFKHLDGNTYFGVSHKMGGYKLAPYTFTIE